MFTFHNKPTAAFKQARAARHHRQQILFAARLREEAAALLEAQREPNEEYACFQPTVSLLWPVMAR